MAGVSDHRYITCPHGNRCAVSFTSVRLEGGIGVTIDDIGCVACSDKIGGTDGAAAEMRHLLVFQYITPALGML